VNSVGGVAELYASAQRRAAQATRDFLVSGRGRCGAARSPLSTADDLCKKDQHESQAAVERRAHEALRENPKLQCPTEACRRRRANVWLRFARSVNGLVLASALLVGAGAGSTKQDPELSGVRE